MTEKEAIFSNIKGNLFQKKHFSKSKIETITQSYLTQVVYWLDEAALVYQYGTFRLAADPQVSVYENMAVDNYTGECYPPIAFLERFYGYTFPQALYLLNYFYYKVLKTPLQVALEDLKDAPVLASRPSTVAAKGSVDLNGILAEDRLAQGDANALRRTFAYLVNTRGLERSVVENFITQGYLKMDSHDNLCFITYADPLDKTKVTAVTVKGTTGKRFNQNKVAEPNTGFFYAAKPQLEANAYEEAFVFESVIDLMAYLSLLWGRRIAEGEGHAVGDRCYIALNGLGNWDYLQRLVMRHSTIKAVTLCLDNDQRGIEGAARLKARLSSLCAVHDLRETGLKPISATFGYCKDWGDAVRLPAHDLGMVG